jgi:hypothetical protein
MLISQPAEVLPFCRGRERVQPPLPAFPLGNDKQGYLETSTLKSFPQMPEVQATGQSVQWLRPGQSCWVPALALGCCRELVLPPGLSGGGSQGPTYVAFEETPKQ